MILKKDQLTFVIPDFHDILYILIELPNEVIHSLTRVTLEHMKKLQERGDVGLPSAFSVEGNKVLLYPRPDREYPKVKVAYLPPPEEI